MILRCHCGTDELIPAAGPHQLPSAPDFHLSPCLHLQHLNFGWEMKGVYSSITKPSNSQEPQTTPLLLSLCTCPAEVQPASFLWGWFLYSVLSLRLW